MQIRRFFRAVNPEHFKQFFCSWVNSIANIVDAKVIAIDGKSNRCTFDGDDKMLHVVMLIRD